VAAESGVEILVLSNIQAKALAGSLLAIGEEIYRLKDYDPAYPGVPPWRSGAEGKAYPLLGQDGSVLAYLKFFTRPTQKRLNRTAWLIGQQIHTWLPGLAAAPLFWVDTRLGPRSAGAGFDFAGCLASAVPGDTWLERKNQIAETGASLPAEFRWRCVADLVLATAVLEQAGIVHGDLSPNNVIVDLSAPPDKPALYLIDFDAFVASAAGADEAVSVAEGGTFGTDGYCPPELGERAAAGDDSATPYSDRYGRDMLILELLLMDRGLPAEDPPEKWNRSRLQQLLGAMQEGCDPARRQTLEHLQIPQVFSLPEQQRPTSTELAARLGLELPESPVICGDAEMGRAPSAVRGIRSVSAHVQQRSRRRKASARPPKPSRQAPTTTSRSLNPWLVGAQVVPRSLRRPRPGPPKDSPATILATVVFLLLIGLLLFIPSCPQAHGFSRSSQRGACGAAESSLWSCPLAKGERTSGSAAVFDSAGKAVDLGANAFESGIQTDRAAEALER
jgi:hypothetical protein